MRFARKMGVAGHGSLTILKPGTWDFKYKGEDATWITTFDGFNQAGYTQYPPTIDSSGVHVFNSLAGGYVSSARSSVPIDLSAYSKIKVSYNVWRNSSDSIYPSVIEFLTADERLIPVKDVATDNPLCWFTVTPSTSSPGEFVYTIPSAMKYDKTPRYAWIKAISVQYRGIGRIEITKITLE